MSTKITEMAIFENRKNLRARKKSGKKVGHAPVVASTKRVRVEGEAPDVNLHSKKKELILQMFGLPRRSRS